MSKTKEKKEEEEKISLNNILDILDDEYSDETELLQEVVKYLKDNPDFDINTIIEGTTLLNIMAEENIWKVCKLLISYGANVNICDNETGKNFIHMFFEEHYYENLVFFDELSIQFMLKLLKDGKIDINIYTSDYKSLLSFILYVSEELEKSDTLIEFIKELVITMNNQNKGLINIPECEGKTPLYFILNNFENKDSVHNETTLDLIKFMLENGANPKFI